MVGESTVPDDEVIGGALHAFVSVPSATFGSISQPSMVVATLSFDADGVLLDAETEELFLTDDSPVDADLWASVYASHALALESYAVVVGEAAALVDGEEGGADMLGGCRASDCGLGRLLNGAMLEACGDCDVALSNAGGLRADLGPGAISRGDVRTALPFDNTLMALDISGAGLRAALAVAAAKAPDWWACPDVANPTCAGDGCDESACGVSGGHLQTLGLRWAYNAETDEVLGAEVFDNATKSWYDLDDDRTYRVATNSYLANGGDGYAPLPAFGSNQVELAGGTQSDVLGAAFEDGLFPNPLPDGYRLFDLDGGDGLRAWSRNSSVLAACLADPSNGGLSGPGREGPELLRRRRGFRARARGGRGRVRRHYVRVHGVRVGSSGGRLRKIA